MSACVGNDSPSEEIFDLGIVQKGRVGLGTGSPGEVLSRLESVSKVLLTRKTAPTISFARESTEPIFEDFSGIGGLKRSRYRGGRQKTHVHELLDSRAYFILHSKLRTTPVTTCY